MFFNFLDVKVTQSSFSLEVNLSAFLLFFVAKAHTHTHTHTSPHTRGGIVRLDWSTRKERGETFQKKRNKPFGGKNFAAPQMRDPCCIFYDRSVAGMLGRLPTVPLHQRAGLPLSRNAEPSAEAPSKLRIRVTCVSLIYTHERPRRPSH